MLFSPDPQSQTTQPLPMSKVTRQLTIANTSAQLPALQTGQPTPTLNGSITTVRLPTVIPAAEKRRPQPTSSPSPQQRYAVYRRPLWLLAILLSTLLMGGLASFFVIPLGTDGQHPRTLAQTISDWITGGQSDAINTLQHNIPITPVPTFDIPNGHGSCAGYNLWTTCSTDVTVSGVMGTGIMQRPLLGAVITQVFANPEYQLWCGCWKPHTGIDLATTYGTPIMAADSGQVIWTGWDTSGLGWAVKINHGHYLSTIYGHMARFIVKVGQNVTKGQTIGYEGSTGASTGPHLHFMVLLHDNWVNPILYVPLP